jgi:hypothetical protein
MVCPSATSEAEARWPRFGLVVVATTGRCDNKDQMIRPLEIYDASHATPRLWKDQLKNDLRSDQDHRQKIDLRSRSRSRF